MDGLRRISEVIAEMEQRRKAHRFGRIRDKWPCLLLDPPDFAFPTESGIRNDAHAAGRAYIEQALAGATRRAELGGTRAGVQKGRLEGLRSTGRSGFEALSRWVGTTLELTEKHEPNLASFCILLST